MSPAGPDLQVGFPPWPQPWGCPELGLPPVPCSRAVGRAHCDVLPCALGGKAPRPCSTLTLPDAPGKLLSVAGLATGDSQLLRAEIPHGHDVDGAIFCTITPVCSG